MHVSYSVTVEGMPVVTQAGIMSIVMSIIGSFLEHNSLPYLLD